MKDNEYFYQDFLYQKIHDDFNLEIKYINDASDYFDITISTTIFDIDCKKRYISFNYLLELLDKSTWDNLFKICKDIDKLVIIDDCKIVNQKLEQYKLFFLKVYIFNLEQYVSEVYVYLA